MMNQSQPPQPSKANVYLIAALLISVVIAAFVQRNALLNPLAVNDDVRNQIYWMARLTDPGLYPNDLIAEYFTQNSLISPVVWVLYQLASLVMDPVRTGQWLPLLLAPVATYFTYRFAESDFGKRYAFLAAFSFNLIIWISHNMAGGLARAFAYPMLFAFLFYLRNNNRRGLILTSLAAGLIYPPILFLNAGIWLFSLLFPPDKPQGKTGAEIATDPLLLEAKNIAQKPLDKATFFWGMGGGLAILAYRFLLAPAPATFKKFGTLANSALASKTPEFYEGGRVAIFSFFQQPINLPWPNAFFAELLARTPSLNRSLPLLGIVLGFWLFQKYLAPQLGKLKVPTLVWRCFAAAVAMYIVSWILLFYLYVPERYLQLSIPVLYTFLLAGLLDVMIRQINQFKLSAKIKSLLVLAPPMIAALIFSMVWDENLLKPDTDMMTVCRYLKETPKNTLIATTPGLANDIPLYAKRSVLVSQEAYIPFHQTYFKAMKIRLKDFLMAYYSVEPAVLIQFVQKYKVDYLIVNKQDFTHKRLNHLHKKYYHSFPKSFYQQLTQGHQPQDYLLSHPQPACRAVETGQFILIPTRALLSPGCIERSASLVSKP